MFFEFTKKTKTERTHQEDVTGLDIQKEINDQNLHQANLLQRAISKNGARCLHDSGQRGDIEAEMGMQRRGRQRQGGNAVQHSSFLMSASLPVWEQAVLPVHGMLNENLLCLLYSTGLILFLSRGTLCGIKLYISIK